MIFVCVECEKPFEIRDKEIVQAMAYEHLETGCCFTCPECQPNKEEIPSED